MTWIAESLINRPPGSDELGLIVRPIFSGSDPGVLTVSLKSGSLQFGALSGTLTIQQPANSLVYETFCSVDPQIIATPNTSRLMLTVYNNTNRNLFLKLGASASTSSFTVKLIPDAYYELPTPAFTGEITGVWSLSGSGAANVTELTV